MSTKIEGKTKNVLSQYRMWIFPIAVMLVYLIILFMQQDKAETAFIRSLNTLSDMALSLGLVFALMLILNLFLKPAQITRFLGKTSGAKGMIFSIAAGIISTGPIYAWYPLLKELKEKGAGNHIIAVFLHNRSVKPFLLPIMISYFGFTYVVILIIMTIFGSIGIGYAIDALVKDKNSLPGKTRS
jgi:uncharacterized membrane protein YraQ (UPF0718 family)